ncbi:MAG: chemotaxis protein CheW [Thermodesulfovibrionales bacterium]|nr:chemotaxis protein CheW [Thermodesulfovibrionales bacterium]
MDEIAKKENEFQEEIKRPSYCSFRRGTSVYYIPVDILKEVVEVKEIFPVPLAPHYIRGAIPLRGTVIPVIDLNRLERRTDTAVEPDMLMVVEVRGELIGFLSEGLPNFVFAESVPEDGIIDINKFFETYMVRNTA